MIKPVTDSEAAQAPLAEPSDLRLYAEGIAMRLPAIPSDMLSLPHGMIPLPLELPQRFIAEPYVATDRSVHHMKGTCAGHSSCPGI